MMTVVVERQRPLPPKKVSRVESLIQKDPKMTYAEIQDIMKIHREVSLAFFTTALA